MRILPFALASTALHALVLLSAPERLDIAVSPSGSARAVSVRLVPAGPAKSEAPVRGAVAAAVPRQQAPPPSESAGSGSSGPANTEAKTAATASAANSTAPDAPTAPLERRVASAEPAARSAEADTDTTGAEAASQAKRPYHATEPTSAAETEASASSATGKRANRPTPRRTAAAPSGATGRHDRAQLASRARQLVTIRFRERFRYPRIARQRGWEGKVVLAFRVHADGRISDVEVVESSGRAVLDQSARQTLIHIERIPALADRLQAGPLELEVPVTYRLQPA